METILSFMMLGGLYIISNRRGESSREGFVSIEESHTPSIYPIENTQDIGIHTQHTDKYFNGTVNNEQRDSNGNNEFIGLSGDNWTLIISNIRT